MGQVYAKTIEKIQKPDNYKHISKYEETISPDDQYVDLYNSINWTTSCIGGSFALSLVMSYRYDTKKLSYKDIDVFVKCNDENDFLKELEMFKEKAGNNIVKSNSKRGSYWSTGYSTYWLTEYSTYWSAECFTYEQVKYFTYGQAKAKPKREFGKMILLTKTYMFKPRYTIVPIPVQFIGIDCSNVNSTMTIQEIVREIVDYPACITFKVIGNKKIFDVPTCALHMLQTMRVPSKFIHNKERQKKYENYGFTFV